MTFIFNQDNGETRESGFLNKRKGMGYMYQYYEGFGFNANTQIKIDDPENWGWSIAFVEADSVTVLRTDPHDPRVLRSQVRMKTLIPPS